MKGQKKKKRKMKAGWIVLLVLVLLGVIGGVLIKTVFYEKINDSMMSNKEANRLISYLGVGEYNYPDRLGSSFNVKSARELLATAQVDESAVDVPLGKLPGFTPLSRKQFETMYEALIEKLELGRLRSINLYIYDINNANDKEIDGVVYELVNTSEGDFYMEKDYGLDSQYIGKVVRLYVSNNEIILCLGESEESITIHNAYAMKCEAEQGSNVLIAYVSGSLHEFAIDKKGSISSDMKECLCDIQITNKGAYEVVDHTKQLESAKVLSYEDGYVTLEGKEDPYFLSESFNVYKTKGKLRAMQSAGTLIGYENVSLYCVDQVIEAALLEEDIYEKEIRVLISNSDYTNYYHDYVTITSDTDFEIAYGDTKAEYKAKDKVEFRNGSKELAAGSAKIYSKEEGGRITVSSIKRQSGMPSYRGTIELTRDDKGVLVINELPVEEYLYGVVPSEMPASFEAEALKAQAICARAYAYRLMESDTYASYGAHLDDSISCQVYNNVEEDERTIFAVDDTYGVVPCYNDQVIEAFFFSTSCGTTTNNSVVWGGNPEPYLLDTMETELNDMADLKNETSFKAFLNGELGAGFIEAEEPFFRWEVSFSKGQLSDAVNKHIYDRINAMPDNILVMNANGVYEKKDIRSVGDVESIEVTKRGLSGIIEELVIHGSTETVLVKGQSNARALLSPETSAIRKQDGSTAEHWATLPSAYFYVEKTNAGFTIHGGGFGHGVGMSQNGANDMAKMGYYASDILNHYYTAVELKDMYEMMGK